MKATLFVDGRKSIENLWNIPTEELTGFYKKELEKYPNAVGVSFTAAQFKHIVDHFGGQDVAEHYFGCQIRGIEEV